MTQRQTAALPVYCAYCKDEIEMPCTYLIVPRGGFRGLYHIGCQPLTVDAEIATGALGQSGKDNG